MKVLVPKARAFPAVGIRIYNFSNLSGGQRCQRGVQIIICSVAPDSIWAFRKGFTRSVVFQGRNRLEPGFGSQAALSFAPAWAAL